MKLLIGFGLFVFALVYLARLLGGVRRQDERCHADMCGLTEESRLDQLKREASKRWPEVNESTALRLYYAQIGNTLQLFAQVNAAAHPGLDQLRKRMKRDRIYLFRAIEVDRLCGDLKVESLNLNSHLTLITN